MLQSGEQLGPRVSGRVGAVDQGPGRCLSRPPRPGSGAGDRRSLALARGERAGLSRAEPRSARFHRPVHAATTRAAAAQLAPVVRRRQARGAGEPSLYPARELAIEALIAVGDLDEARVQLEWLEEAGRRLGTPWPLAMGARCRGLLQAAEGDLEAALASCEQSAGGARAHAGAVRARPYPAHLRHDPSPGEAAKGRAGGDRGGASRSSRRCRLRSGPQTRGRSWRGSAVVRPRATR